MKFTAEEKDMIFESIALRQKINGEDEKYDKLFETIKWKLQTDFGNLNRTEKNLLRGCLRDSEINTNSHLYSRTELDLLLSDKSLKAEYHRFDVANGLMNKFKNKTDLLEHIFNPTFHKIEKIKKAKTILFSRSNSGNIYKLAFITDGKGGYRIDFKSRKIMRFEKKNLNPTSFTNKIPFTDLSVFLKEYVSKNAETEVVDVLRIMVIQEK